LTHGKPPPLSKEVIPKRKNAKNARVYAENAKKENQGKNFVNFA
jgi:hypothetical protein